jgi:hypothetical protein
VSLPARVGIGGLVVLGAVLVFSIAYAPLRSSASISTIPSGYTGPVTRDSAQVVITEFSLDALLPFGTVDSLPNASYGAEADGSGGHPLRHVRAAIPLSRSRIALINGGTEEILVVDSSFSSAQLVGKRGNGPSEFQALAYIAETKAGIGGFDYLRRRWVEFDSSGSYVDSWAVRPIGPNNGPFFPELITLFGGGFLVTDAVLPPDAVGGRTVRRPLLVARILGESVDTLALVPGDMGIVKGIGVSPTPFRAGYGLQIRSDSTLWIGDTSDREVRLIDDAGTVLRLIRWHSSASRALTQERIEEGLEAVVGNRSPEIRGSIRGAWKRLEMPQQVPAWSTIRPGVDGSLWIGSYTGTVADLIPTRPHPAQQWWGVDSSGRPTGTLESTAGFEPMFFGSDYVVGIHIDDVGIETLQKRMIRPPSADSAER